MKTQNIWTAKETAKLTALKAEGKTHAEIAIALGRTKTAVDRKVDHDHVSESKQLQIEHKLPPPDPGQIPLKAIDDSGWYRFGLVADTHLCCKESRLDALNVQYDLFKKEGIRVVLHAGNIVDGFVSRINGASALVTSIDGQARYVVDKYPKLHGVKTYFITGDDHEGWWQKEGFNFGAYLQMTAEKLNRTDLRYIGHVESDVTIRRPGAARPTIIKVQHPGGGSAYSRSYTGQQTVGSFQGGEKPAILIQGHYHVSNYMHDRNVHVISMPGFQDQTIFARKKRLRMEIGGAILEFKIDKQGAVTRCRVEFNMFFDRGYYKEFLPSDSDHAERLEFTQPDHLTNYGLR